MSDIMPFGKYKGQNISCLSNDRDYAVWIIQNTNTQTKHPKLYSSILKLLNINDELYHEVIKYIKSNIIKFTIDDPIYNKIKTSYNENLHKLIDNVKKNYRNKYDVSAIDLLYNYKKNLQQIGVSNTDFDNFFKKFKVTKLAKVCENIRNLGGHDSRFTQGWKIAQKNSAAQESYWKNLLDNIYKKSSKFIYHPPIENGCIFDFINNTKKIIYEVKLSPSDFDMSQYLKYKNQKPEYTIRYLFDRNAIWHVDTNELFVCSSVDITPSNIPLNLEYYLNRMNSLREYFYIQVIEIDDLSDYL